MLHVGIDATPIIYGRGVSRYTSNLIVALIAQKELALSLYGSSLRQKSALQHFAQSLNKTPEKIVWQSYPPSALRLLWQLHRNSIHSVLPQIEVFHSWDYLQPPDTKLPLVSTIHDLAMLKYPKTAHPALLEAHKKSWEVLRQRQAHIITVSEAVRADVLKLLAFAPDHVHTVYSALPRETRLAADSLSQQQQDALATRLHATEPFVLFVGTREPRKNVTRLVQAWQAHADTVSLIIAGGAGWDEDAALDHPRIHVLGSVSDAELAVLYQRAQLLLYPSLDEGFGLPILEAFSFGLPVVTSNRGAMAEVAGNAAVLVDPESEESIMTGIATLLSESPTEKELRQKQMTIRTQLFSWNRTAAETMAVYQLAKASNTQGL